MGRGRATGASVAVLLLLVLLAVSGMPRPVVAQTDGSVSIIVIDLGGKLLPIEQFKSDTREGCPLGGAPLAPHFRTRSGGPAIATDLTEVADPNRSGCGYGLVQTGAVDSAMVRIADMRPADLDAWNAKTGLSAGIVGISSSPPRANELVPTPSAPSAGWATGIARILMIVGAALAAGLLVGALVYRREQRRARADLDRAYPAYPEPDDAPLDEHHAGMLTLPEVIAPPQEEAVLEDDAPPAALDYDESQRPPANG